MDNLAAPASLARGTFGQGPGVFDFEKIDADNERPLLRLYRRAESELH